MAQKNTKRFINKKNAVTFKLGHRSQQDPLVADESAPQRVLIPVSKHNENQASISEEQKISQKYEVVFDKDYDYLQNLTDTRTLDNEWERTRKKIDASKSSDQKITLPASVFESNVEEKVGLLNKAAPNPGLNLNLDSDIIAALDDDFDFDDPSNQLEDNFIELANQQLSIDGSDEDFFYNEVDFESEECPFSKEETKSRFTEYSISSNMMRRNDQLNLLDDKFEKLYADYDEHVLGPLDCEEIEGVIGIDSERLLQISDKYSKDEHEVENIVELMNNSMTLKKEHQTSSDPDSDTEIKKPVTLYSNNNKWDCESILSVYNNKDNLPKFIQEFKNPHPIKINAKTGIPMDSTPKLTHKAVGNLPSEIQTTCTESNNLQKTCTSNKPSCMRPTNESSEEKKQRKQFIKNERRERRKERKINLLAFKEEEKKQKKILLNKNQNIQGNRIL